jgi:hypothetical protein
VPQARKRKVLARERSVGRIQGNGRPTAPDEFGVLIFRTFDGILPRAKARSKKRAAVQQDVKAPSMATEVLQRTVDLPLLFDHRPEQFRLADGVWWAFWSPPQDVVCCHRLLHRTRIGAGTNRASVTLLGVRVQPDATSQLMRRQEAFRFSLSRCADAK